MAMEAYRMLSQLPELNRQMQAVKQMMQTVSSNSRAGPGTGAGRKSNPGSRRNKNKNKKGTNGSSSASGAGNAIGGLGRPIYTADNQSLKMAFNDIVTINNTGTAGVANVAIALSAGTTTGLPTLATFLGRFSTMSSLYRQFTINRVCFEFVPVVPYTGYGQVAMGVDPACIAGLPGAFASVIRHNKSCLFDIKSTGIRIVYNPTLDRKKDPRFCQGGTGIDEDELSFGMFQLYSTGNSVLASATIGTLLVSLDVTFLGPF